MPKAQGCGYIDWGAFSVACLHGTGNIIPDKATRRYDDSPIENPRACPGSELKEVGQR